MFDNKAEISFVEVVVHFFEAGETGWRELIEQLELFGLNLDEYGKDIEEIVEGKVQTRKNEEEAKASGKNWWINVVSDWEKDFTITKPFVGFEFRCFGQNFDDTHSSGLAYEIYSMGNDYVFENYKDELQKMACNLRDKFKIRRLQDDWTGNTVRFVTLWSYLSWQDSYWKEWDSEWELLGLVEPSKKLVETPPLSN